MRMRRIAGATTVLALVVLTAVGAGAKADYPTRVVKVIVPLTPGSQPELAFRVIGEKLQARWGQPVVVEARPGASQNIGADAVAKAEPDGHTLLFTPPAPLVTSKWLYKSLSFDPDAFTPVLVAFQSSLVLMINPRLPTKTLAELIAYAKANPGKLTYAHPGVTSVPNLAMGAFLRRAGISVVPVAYTSLFQGMQDLVAGHVDLIMDPSPLRAMELHLEGKLKVLAVASPDPLLPDVRAISEVLPAFEFAVWYGMVAPPKTPPAVTDKLAREITEILRMPDVVKRLAQLGYNPVESTPADMTALIRKDNDYWREAIEAAGLTKSK
jgi:tripartite-type tricarboxylate transporter receptor subunit TctC